MKIKHEKLSESYRIIINKEDYKHIEREKVNVDAMSGFVTVTDRVHADLEFIDNVLDVSRDFANLNYFIVTIDISKQKAKKTLKEIKKVIKKHIK